MIEKLTKEQESKLPEYVDKFVRLGLSTQSFTEESKIKVTEVMNRIYEVGGLSKPKEVLFFSNPVEMCYYAKQCGDVAPENNFIYGSFDSGWLSFYAFIKNELPEVKNIEIIQPLIDLLGLCSFVLPYKEVALVSQNPTKILKNNNGLHSFNESALEYAYTDEKNKFIPLYYINGIEVPEWVVLTPVDKLDAKEILKLKNVDQRREALRKIGADNLVTQLKGKTLDLVDIGINNCKEYGFTENIIDKFIKREGRPLQYTLLQLDFGDGMFTKYLKMDNPSVKHIHIEGVPNSCNVVKDALSFRNEQALAALGIKKFSAESWVAPTQLT